MLEERIAGPKARVTIRHERAGVLLSEETRWNTVTDAGRRQIHTYIYGGGSQRLGLGGGLNYIGLSNDAAVPGSGDTTLTGELTNLATPGLGRSQGTVTLPTGSGTSTVITNAFFYTGVSSQAVQKAAIFDAASGGVMAHEIQFSPRTLFPDDTLTISYTITIS